MLIKQARGSFIIHQLIACKSKRSLWRLKTTGKSSYLVGHFLVVFLSIAVPMSVTYLVSLCNGHVKRTHFIKNRSALSIWRLPVMTRVEWTIKVVFIHKSHQSFTVILRQAAKCVRKWRSEINVWYQKIKYMMNSYSWIVSAKRRGEGRGRQAAFYG